MELAIKIVIFDF